MEYCSSVWLSIYNLSYVRLFVCLFRRSAPCHAVLDSMAGPVLAASPRKAMPWRLAGVVKICRPMNNPPLPGGLMLT